MLVTFGALYKLTAVALLFEINSYVQLQLWLVNNLEAVLLHGTKAQNCLPRPRTHCLHTSIPSLAILAKLSIPRRPWKVARTRKTTARVGETMVQAQKTAQTGKTVVQAQKTTARARETMEQAQKTTARAKETMAQTRKTTAQAGETMGQALTTTVTTSPP